MRIVAITSGGDWYDASCGHYTVPDGLDLKLEQKAYRKWYAESYLPMRDIKFLNFGEWLIANRGVQAADVEVFEED